MKWIRWGLLLAALTPAAAQSVTPPLSPNSAAGIQSLAAKKSTLIAALSSAARIDKRVVDALGRVPRELFLPAYLKDLAYEDSSLPIGGGVIASAPSEIARALTALSPQPTDRVLVYGAADGYLAALISWLSASVLVVELSAAKRPDDVKAFAALRLRNVTVAPGTAIAEAQASIKFDKIFIHGAANALPEGFLGLLTAAGRLVVPLRDPSGLQTVLLVTNGSAGVSIRSIGTGFYAPIDLAAGR